MSNKQRKLLSSEDRKLAEELSDEYANLLKQRSEAYKIVYDIDIKININQDKFNVLMNKYGL